MANNKNISGAYKIQVVVFSIFFIVFASLLIFYFRAFEHYKKTEIISVSSADSLYSRNVTYMVDGVQYTTTVLNNWIGKNHIFYKVSDPNILMTADRPLWLTLCSIIVVISGGLIIGVSAQEFKWFRKRAVN